MREPLLVAQLDARKIEHAVLHGAQHLLAAAGAHALIERADDAPGEMQAGAGVADLRTGHQRRSLAEAGGRSGAARALRDVLVDLAVLVGAGAEALDRRDDHARVGLVDVLPGQPHAVERAGREILHQHVAMLDQPLEDFLALGMLRVDRDRALVAIEHREVERVLALYVTELTSCDVADAGPLDLDAVGAHVAEELRAGRARLHVREVEDLHAVERLAGLPERLGRRRRQSVRRRRLDGRFARRSRFRLPARGAVRPLLGGDQTAFFGGGFLGRPELLGGWLGAAARRFRCGVALGAARGGGFPLHALCGSHFLPGCLCHRRSSRMSVGFSVVMPAQAGVQLRK